MQTDVRDPFLFCTKTRHKVLEWDFHSSEESGEKYFNFLDSSGHSPLISAPHTFGGMSCWSILGAQPGAVCSHRTGGSLECCRGPSWRSFWSRREGIPWKPTLRLQPSLLLPCWQLQQSLAERFWSTSVGFCCANCMGGAGCARIREVQLCVRLTESCLGQILSKYCPKMQCLGCWVCPGLSWVCQS